MKLNLPLRGKNKVFHWTINQKLTYEKEQSDFFIYRAIDLVHIDCGIFFILSKIVNRLFKWKSDIWTKKLIAFWTWVDIQLFATYVAM